ncbi:lactase/phlorizin hydrolase-like [Sardina pilchardus]|uniref:lactase/phlorizin hydrolase-like n=1 Tax=Sardina pilchardus TaxID=27697 RepID=UPI002E153C98
MMVTTFLLSLCLLSLQGCHGKGDIPQEFMLLAGPLTHSLVKDLTLSPSATQTFPSEVTDDAFDCSHALPSKLRDHFQYLQSRGVTHYKVPLSWSHILPTGDPSRPHRDTVSCYRTLLEQLTESGLQPLVVLHRSAVPEGLRATLGDWDSPQLPEAFERYAEFVFAEFRDSVKYWITFSHLDELSGDEDKASSASALQGALHAHGRVYQLYHRMVSGKVLANWRDGRVLGCDVQDFLGEVRDNIRLTKHNGNAKLQNKKSLSTYQNVWQSFSSQSPSERDDFLIGSFPEGFQWAVSSESFKVEGGWSEDGKGETIWDRFGHQGHVFDSQTADLACDSYNKVDYDVYLLRGLHTNTFQFSISWARIFPTGHRGSLSEKGALYYDNLINTLLQSNIEPVVTLYHWDLPQALQDNEGWTNPTIVEAFKDFADFCFSRFGDRVKTWNTFSSPWVVSHSGYGTDQHAPGVKDPVISSYQVTHNILKSHAEAWHVYNDNYKTQQGGRVGIALNSDWAEPVSPQDTEAAERYLDFMLGWFAHPIFVNGDYPAKFKTHIEQKKKECLVNEAARLPVFTEAEKLRIKGTADFFGLNHYTTRLVNGSSGQCVPGPHGVGDFQSHVDPSWPTTESSWVQVVPWGLRRLLKYISAQYTSVTKVPIHITGTGMPTAYSGDVLNDVQRVGFLRGYINEALKAINLDGVNIQKFTVQSLMDGFEGPQGYSQRYGLHYVDFEDLNRPRTPKKSAYFYSEIVQKNGFADVQKKTAGSISFKHPSSTRLPSLPSSEVPSKAKVVWEKFSSQTKFQRTLYHYGTFPEGFQWGVSSSAYQIEGAWNTDGKGPSVWDTFTQKPGNIPSAVTGNVACDSYNKVEEDLYMLRALGVKSYRFSLSWSRIFPNGHRSSMNQKGVDYYNKLIDGLIANKINPMVTLYHWDLPQALQDDGGWENLKMIDIFNDFCDFCFATFGDRVKFWITFNQPYTIAWSGYGLGQFPPNVKDPGHAPYRIAHNLLNAHAKVYHTYGDKYRPTQRGLVSISLNADWVEPKDPNDPRQVTAADRALQFQLGWFAHPIFKNGDYPDAMIWQVSNKSEFQDLGMSRLPILTDQEKAYIQGTADVFCINSYTTNIVRHATTALIPPSYDTDQDLGKEEIPDSPTTPIQGQKAVAWGLRRLLNWIKEEYGDPDIYITENGMASPPAVTVEDTDRTFFMKAFIDEALKAHNLDGVKVKGYAWYSLMDNFEWLNGYQLAFGLHHVDFTNLLRPRTPKQTAHLYHKIITENGFPETMEFKLIYGHFPDGFAWSSSTAAYQTEGGWRSGGKGLSIWDQFSHTPGKIKNDDNGDIACDSYNKFLEDVSNLKILKVGHYRLSISWSRVLPDGTINNINEAGFAFYHRLIDALLEANIKPQVTLYHWDLPQALQDMGGWENDSSVQWFKDYADIVFNRLGDKVKFWITFNEPWIVAAIGYGYGTFAPGISDRPGTGPYIVTHNIIKSHAEAWHVYNDKYRAKQGGIVSITINHDWAFPRNPSKQDDLDMVNRYNQFFIGWYAHPIFKGDYHEITKNVVRERSLAAGLPKSRLPEFTPSEIQRINGTHDYFGLNHYTSIMAFRAGYSIDVQSYDADRGTAGIHDWTWLETGSSWLRFTPHAFRKLLNYIKDEYGNPPIYVTENGVSEVGPVDLNDIHRIHYYENYINQALKAYLIDGVDLRGYTAWSLMDNYEWASGYSERFGLFYVNRSDFSLPRVPKRSAQWYTSVIRCNGFPDPSQGPHECLTTEPQALTTTPSPVEPAVVWFLGMEVSLPDAATALNVLFSLSIIGAVAVAVMTYQNFRVTKKSKLTAGNGCHGKGDIPQEFMLLAGPLTHSLVKDLTLSPSATQTFPSEVTDDAFDCSHALPSKLRDHFQYLQSRGVTHYKVPLSWSHILPTGDPSRPHRDTVSCYRTLLEQLTESGLQPLVVLHRSAVPEGLRATLGDWDSPQLPEAFERYAEFVFAEFRDSVKYWITFSHLDELSGDEDKASSASALQGALHAHDRVYQLYHRMVSGKEKGGLCDHAH